MQPVQIVIVPDGPRVTYVLACKTCGTRHAPDVDYETADARAWEAKLRAQHGGTIPIPLPRTPPELKGAPTP